MTPTESLGVILIIMSILLILYFPVKALCRLVRLSFSCAPLPSFLLILSLLWVRRSGGRLATAKIGINSLPPSGARGGRGGSAAPSP